MNRSNKDTQFDKCPPHAWSEERENLHALKNQITDNIKICYAKIENAKNHIDDVADEDISFANVSHQKNIITDNDKILSRLKQFLLEGDPYYARIDLSSEEDAYTCYVAPHRPRGFDEKNFTFNEDCQIIFLDEYETRPLFQEIKERINNNSRRAIVINGVSYKVKVLRKMIIKDFSVKDIANLYDASINKDMPDEIVDIFLLKLLKKYRMHGESEDLLKSIQADQYDIMTAPYADNLLLQGCAGSGKTQILLYRISYLMTNNWLPEQNSSVFITSNTLNRFFHQNTLKNLFYDRQRKPVDEIDIVSFYIHILHSYGVEIPTENVCFFDDDLEYKFLSDIYNHQVDAFKIVKDKVSTSITAAYSDFNAHTNEEMPIADKYRVLKEEISKRLSLYDTQNKITKDFEQRINNLYEELEHLKNEKENIPIEIEECNRQILEINNLNKNIDFYITEYQNSKHQWEELSDSISEKINIAKSEIQTLRASEEAVDAERLIEVQNAMLSYQASLIKASSSDAYKQYILSMTALQNIIKENDVDAWIDNQTNKLKDLLVKVSNYKSQFSDVCQRIPTLEKIIDKEFQEYDKYDTSIQPEKIRKLQ